MDTSKDYVKMCEGAEEIQEVWQPKEGDIYLYHSGRCIEVILPYHGEDIEVTHLGNSKINPKQRCRKNHRNYLWLPWQDQLQGMIEHKSPQMLADFYISIDCPDISYEQLWLAFVMEEKYNKKWDRKGWI